MFPGLVYRLASSHITFLIFVSGKIVITGAKARDDLYTSFEELYPVLQQFAKSSSAITYMTKFSDNKTRGSKFKIQK